MWGSEPSSCAHLLEVGTGTSPRLRASAVVEVALQHPTLSSTSKIRSLTAPIVAPVSRVHIVPIESGHLPGGLPSPRCASQRTPPLPCEAPNQRRCFREFSLGRGSLTVISSQFSNFLQYIRICHCGTGVIKAGHIHNSDCATGSVVDKLEVLDVESLRFKALADLNTRITHHEPDELRVTVVNRSYASTSGLRDANRVRYKDEGRWVQGAKGAPRDGPLTRKMDNIKAENWRCIHPNDPPNPSCICLGDVKRRWAVIQQEKEAAQMHCANVPWTSITVEEDIWRQEQVEGDRGGSVWREAQERDGAGNCGGGGVGNQPSPLLYADISAFQSDLLFLLPNAQFVAVGVTKAKKPELGGEEVMRGRGFRVCESATTTASTRGLVYFKLTFSGLGAAFISTTFPTPTCASPQPSLSLHGIGIVGASLRRPGAQSTPHALHTPLSLGLLCAWHRNQGRLRRLRYEEQRQSLPAQKVGRREVQYLPPTVGPHSYLYFPAHHNTPHLPAHSPAASAWSLENGRGMGGQVGPNPT
ncbi:hypothetical protein K438DRAFT_1749490 [Mycena galopus ATCC 62051]|nr:hypothetical protein K438DRAFT_1749490 [Mycena galopus ATCC 62051]